MAQQSNTQPTHQPHAQNPVLRRLDKLVGAWDAEIPYPPDSPTVVRSQTHFAWHESGVFLVKRGHVQPEAVEKYGFPGSEVSIVGCDDSLESYCMLYSDSRGVSRLYQMSLDEKTWKLWRDAPGFNQRFTGTFSDDGNTITGQWETSADGATWQLDFHTTYKKVAN